MRSVDENCAQLSAFAIEQSALAGLFVEDADIAAVAQAAAVRLNLYAEEGDGEWTGQPGAQGAVVFTRTLLQVSVEHEEDANDLFAKLMGDVVEPRREFIQDNALDAAVDV